MNPFREMILISENEYQRLRKQVLNNNNTEIQKELDRIPEIYGENLPIDQKQKLEGAILSRHLQKSNPDDVEIMQTVSPPAPALDDALLKQHLESFAATNKKRSLQVYQHLKSYKPRWDSLGQFMNSDNTPIPQSSIIELIDSITSAKRSNRLPVGFKQFVEFVNESNIPRNFLSSQGLAKLDKQLNETNVTDDDDEIIQSDASTSWTRLT